MSEVPLYPREAGLDLRAARSLVADLLRVRKVDVRLPGKGKSKFHGVRPVHLTFTMIK